jgi:hypothetical protein
MEDTVPRKRTTLPKDFSRGEVLTVAELEEIFSKVEVSAVERGYYKKTALMSNRLDVDGVRWLLEQGADVDAVDRYGNTALEHHSSFRWPVETMVVLLEHGADPNATGSSSPLAAAVERMNLELVHVLLDAGADPLRVIEGGWGPRTALDRLMARFNGFEATKALEVVQILVGRGATISGETPTYMRSTMSTLQGALARGHGSAEDLAALMTIFELLGVEPTEPPRMLAADEPITTTRDGWEAQYSELWTMLVPPGGSAESVQGEVVRIAGRVGYEILTNGGGNWDGDFDRMLVAFGEHVRSGGALDEPSLARVDSALRSLRGGRFDKAAVDALTEESVRWVLRNPDRVPLSAPAYRR